MIKEHIANDIKMKWARPRTFRCQSK